MKNDRKHIKVIRTEKDYNAAITRIDELILAHDRGENVDEELDLLSVLVEAYENEHHPLEKPHPIEAIKFMMEQMGLNRSAFGDLIGSRSRASEILNLRRGLSIDMIRRINKAMQIPVDVLIQDYKLRGRSNRPVSA